MSTTQLKPLNDALAVFQAHDIAHLETQLRACAGVCDGAVALRADRPAGRRLVAYLQVEAGAALPLAALCARLAHVVPAGLVPATFVTVDALPRQADGALDLDAMPHPDSAALGLCVYEIPDGPVERAISEVWRDVLGVESVGRQANFFELGGNSALAIQAIFRLRRDIQVEVTMRDLFATPTLQGFAACVSARIRLAPASLAVRD